MKRLILKSQKAFTLLEMLIVVAIVAMLAAILFPVFSRAREVGRRSTCQMNLRQIGIAFQQYTQDSDGWISPKTLGNATPRQISWPSMLVPYIKNTQIFVCPSQTTNDVWTAPNPKFIDVNAGSTKKPRYCGYSHGDVTSASMGVPFAGKPITYSRNLIVSRSWIKPSFLRRKSGFLAIAATSTTSGPVLHEAAVEDPSGTIHIVDAITGGTNAPNSACGGGASALISIDGEVNTDHYRDAESSKPAYRHSEGFNALYGDGHVKWRQWGSTSAGEWSIQAND